MINLASNLFSIVAFACKAFISELYHFNVMGKMFLFEQVAMAEASGHNCPLVSALFLISNTSMCIHPTM